MFHFFNLIFSKFVVKIVATFLPPPELAKNVNCFVGLAPKGLNVGFLYWYIISLFLKVFFTVFSPCYVRNENTNIFVTLPQHPSTVSPDLSWFSTSLLHNSKALLGNQSQETFLAPYVDKQTRNYYTECSSGQPSQ